jgi:hypothetical protein
VACPAAGSAAHGFGHRPTIASGFNLIGAEPPGTPCAHCGKPEGDVFLIRGPGMRSEALHEGCAAAFFQRGKGD